MRHVLKKLVPDGIQGQLNGHQNWRDATREGKRAVEQLLG